MGWTNRLFIESIDLDGFTHLGKPLRLSYLPHAYPDRRYARTNNTRQERILTERRKARRFKRSDVYDKC